MKDALGKAIVVSDIVAYPIIDRSRYDIRFGVIEKVNEDDVWLRVWSRSKLALRVQKIRRTDRMLKIPVAQVYLASKVVEGDDLRTEMKTLYALSLQLAPRG